MPNIVHVAVAVIVNENDEVCISLRHKDAHQGDLWEFPGGKVEQEETVEQALIREIYEELNIDIIGSRPLITITHKYPDKTVCLHVRKVLSYHGVAAGVEGQQVKWLPLHQLSENEFPAANSPIIKSLQLPEKYLITGGFIDNQDFIKKLDNALNSDIKLVQLRLKNDNQKDYSQAQVLVETAASLCRHNGAKLMLNISDAYVDVIDLKKLNFAGFHADSRTLMRLTHRPAGQLFSASCHNKEELLKAQQVRADFAVLSPVKKTASHPDAKATGWQQFASLIENISMPVYALGGVSENDMENAWLHGGQGVAAISAFWDK